MNCKCDSCVGACNSKPGWFKPDQINPLAKFLKMSVNDVFKKYLAVDWYVNHPETGEEVFVIAPVLTHSKPGNEYPGDPRGTCIFLKDNRCSIHEVKPFECSRMMHSDSYETSQKRKMDITNSWIKHQKRIEKLLGRKPVSKSFTIFDYYGM